MKQQQRQFSFTTQLIRPLFIVFGLFISTQVAADQYNIYNTQIHIDSDGLAVQQPTISQTEILNTLTQAHRLLTDQGQKAKTVVTEHNTEGNMVVAAIMPGGLIYLAYQQSKLKAAETKLTQVENELEDLDADAVTLYKPVYQPIVVARYP